MGDPTTSVSLFLSPNISTLSSARRLFLGLYAAFALTEENAIEWWGTVEQVSNLTFVPTLTGLENVPYMSGGLNHVCAVFQSGNTTCWGRNEYGQLGRGDLVNETVPLFLPKPSVLAHAAQVAAGWFHTCALLASGEVVCWGWNNFGQLGTGFAVNASNGFPTRVSLTNVVAIDAGYYHTCALLSGGTVHCWGSNDYGQVGDGSTFGILKTTPGRAVSLLENVIQIACGGYHTCALLAGGDVRCWGSGALGQLGIGRRGDTAEPSNVVLTGAAQITAGGLHTCATLLAGGAACWGYNGFGQLGVGDTLDRYAPTLVLGL